MSNDKEYFTRQIALWGEETQQSLQNKRIAIIGCGGLGSTLAITLGSSGIGTIHLVDFDTLSVHNLHRQIAYTYADLEKPKAECLAVLLKSRYKGVQVIVHNETFESFTQKEISLDLIIDATDNLPSRAQIDHHAKSQSLPWLHGSVEGFNGYVCFFDKAPFSAFAITDRKPGGITPPIVSFIASLQANFALRFLVGLPIQKDTYNYLYFNYLGAICHKHYHLQY